MFSSRQLDSSGSYNKTAHGLRRNRLLRLAMMSSGASKLTAIALQGLAIPLVYHALGTHRYALFLLISAALATLSLVQLGAGPGLTQAIARAHATENRREEGGALASAFAFVAATSVAGTAACLAVVHMVPSGVLFGPTYAGDQIEVVHAATVAVLIAALSIVLGVVDSALAGYQEQVATNLGMCASNVLSTVALVLLCRYLHPSLIQVILVLFGGPIVCRLTNLILLFTRRPYLALGLRQITGRNFLLIAHTGASFWLIQAMGILEQHGGTYLMAHLTSAQETDIFAVIYRAVCLASSTVGILTQPLWPAFTDAVARHDFTWVNRAVVKIRRAIVMIAVSLATIVISNGGWGIQHLWHIDITGKRTVVVVLGLYLLSNLWTHFHYIVLMGLDRIWSVACLVIVENLVMLSLGRLAVPHFSALGMAAAYLLASVAIPAWVLPRILAVALRSVSIAESKITPLGAAI